MGRKERILSVLKGLAGGRRHFSADTGKYVVSGTGKRGSRKYSYRRFSCCHRFGFTGSGGSFSVEWMQKKESIRAKRNGADGMSLLRCQCAGQGANLPNLRGKHVCNEK